MNRGYVKLYRKVMTNSLWTSEPFTRGQAWIDLLMLANHSDGHIRIRGVKVSVLRGQVGWSEVKLAERWSWSRGKLRRFIKELKTVQQIEQQNNNVTSLLSIVNYDSYQCGDTACSTASSTANGQQTDSKRYPNKKNKKNKNEKNDNTHVSHGDFTTANPAGKTDHEPVAEPDAKPEQGTNQIPYKKESGEDKITRRAKNEYSEAFLAFWDVYPNHKCKFNALKAYNKALNLTTTTSADIIAAARVQASSEDWTRDGGRFIPHAATWLNGRRWEDVAKAQIKTPVRLRMERPVDPKLYD